MIEGFLKGMQMAMLVHRNRLAQEEDKWNQVYKKALIDQMKFNQLEQERTLQDAQRIKRERGEALEPTATRQTTVAKPFPGYSTEEWEAFSKGEPDLPVFEKQTITEKYSPLDEAIRSRFGGFAPIVKQQYMEKGELPWATIMQEPRTMTEIEFFLRHPEKYKEREEMKRTDTAPEVPSQLIPFFMGVAGKIGANFHTPEGKRAIYDYWQTDEGLKDYGAWQESELQQKVKEKRLTEKPKETVSQKMAEWREAFFEQMGRYPTAEETRAKMINDPYGILGPAGGTQQEEIPTSPGGPPPEGRGYYKDDEGTVWYWDDKEWRYLRNKKWYWGTPKS